MSEHPTIRAVQEAVARRFGVTVLDLCSRRRGAAVVRPRHTAMWIARHVTLHSLPEIGRAFGDRDHTTVINGIARIEALMAVNAAFAAVLWTLVESVDCRESVMLRRSMIRMVA
jgi:chromosomal replication initiator protein